MQEKSGALQVGEKLVTETDPFACALDQPGHVGDRELATIGRVDGAEHGGHRRERIIGDFRLGVRDPAQKRGLTGVRKSQESRIGQELQPELELRLFARLAYLCEARRLVRRRGEAAVAGAAEPSTSNHGARARVGQVDEEPAVGVDHLRPDRHPKLDVLAFGPMFVCTLAMNAAAAREPLLPAKCRQIAEVAIGDDRHIPTLASVPTIGPAFRNELLTPKAE